jgi:hypothetical protein
MIVNQAITNIVEAGSFGSLTTTYGLFAILLLVVLLVAKEIMRLFDHAHARRRTAIFDLALAPLLITFAFVVFLRFLRIFGLL